MCQLGLPQMSEMMWITQMGYVLQECWMVKMAWRPQLTLKSYALQIDCSGDLRGFDGLA